MKNTIENWCHAKQFSGWNISLLHPFRGPLITVVCGSCERLFKSRDSAKVNNMGNKLSYCCTHCGTWNLTELVEG